MKGWLLVTLLVLEACVAVFWCPEPLYAQAPNHGNKLVPAAKVKSLTPQLLEALVRGDKQVLKSLKDIFKESQDKREKQTIASKVLSLGERDEEYWSYLVQYAKAAIESPIPDPVAIDKDGRTIRGQFSAQFVAWCDQNKVDPRMIAGEVFYRLPSDVKLLGATRDPRIFELLLRGLESKNSMIVIASAMGLANLQDKRALKPIIATLQRVPTGAGQAIAETSLVYFDDREAQVAVERVISDERTLAQLREMAKRKDILQQLLELQMFQ
jgi:hypothetical protein